MQPGTRSLGNPIVARTTQPPPTHLALLAKPATLQLWYPFAGRTTLLALRANANNFASWSMLLRHSHFLHCGNAGNFAATLQPWQSLCWSHHPHSLRCGHAFGSPTIARTNSHFLLAPMSAALTPPRLPAPPTLLALLAMPAMQLWQSTRSPHHSRFLHCWQCRHRSGNATVGHTTRTSCLVAKNRTCNFGNPTVDRAAHAPCIVWQSRQLCSSRHPLLAAPLALLGLMAVPLCNLAIPSHTAPTRTSCDVTIDQTLVMALRPVDQPRRPWRTPQLSHQGPTRGRASFNTLARTLSAKSLASTLPGRPPRILSRPAGWSQPCLPTTCRSQLPTRYRRPCQGKQNREVIVGEPITWETAVKEAVIGKATFRGATRCVCVSFSHHKLPHLHIAAK